MNNEAKQPTKLLLLCFIQHFNQMGEEEFKSFVSLFCLFWENRDNSPILRFGGLWCWLISNHHITQHAVTQIQKDLRFSQLLKLEIHNDTHWIQFTWKISIEKEKYGGALIEIDYLQRVGEKRAITSFEHLMNNEYDPVQQMEVDQRKHLVCNFLHHN